MLQDPRVNASAPPVMKIPKRKTLPTLGEVTKDVKVKDEENPADILTQYIDQGNIHQHCHGMRPVPESGRPDSAPATSM